MWIFRKRSDHIGLEDLSEYLDGRLADDKRLRAERHLEACSSCAEELQFLEYTVRLLRRVPMVNPRSTFTLGYAPTVAPSRRFPAVPAWAYGAVASVAILLFAATLSADLTGSLASDTTSPTAPDQAVESADDSASEPRTALEPAGFEAAGTPDEQRTAPKGAPAIDLESPSSAPDLMMGATTAKAEAETAPPAAEAGEPESAAAQAVAAPTPASATLTDAVAAPAPTSAPVPATLTAAPVVPTPTPVPATLPTQAPRPEAEGVQEALPAPVADEATPPVWHVVEGLLGFTALLLVGIALWARHVRRRATP